MIGGPFVSGRLRIRPRCPNCAALLDGFSHEGPAVPKPGDLSVCAYCGTFLQFADDLQLVRASEAVMQELVLQQPESAQRLLEYADAVKTMRARRQAKTS